MATTTNYKRIQFARQFMHDAVDWKIIDENPFFLTTEHTEHTEINPPTVMSCFRGFGVFGGSLLLGDTSEYRVCGRRTAVPCGWQYSDGLEDLEPTN
jgi:hypothetical protein